MQAFALKEVKPVDLEKWPNNHDNPDTLGSLWDCIARNVLKKLHINQRPPDKPMPRIRWIPTCTLRTLPLHAVGCHFNCSTDHVMDQVISSYSSSVKALLDAQRYTPSYSLPKESKSLPIAMATTPGQSLLVFAARDVKDAETS